MPVVRNTNVGLIVRACACGLALMVSAAKPANANDKQASFVIDGNTGAVLHAQQADEPRYPASLTKMMTLYLAFEEIDGGRMSEDTMLTVSVACSSMAPSKLGLEVGERIALGNAIKAVVTKSANDMACAIAEAVAGSEDAFARRMTKRARDIGMTNTTFRNASGLPDPRQMTTARDMVTLGLRLRDDFPKQFPVFRLQSFSYGGKTYRSHNTLMNGFGGMDGIKTGYTRASGFNLVSSVQRDGKYVVGAVFGGVSASVRNAHMRMVLFRALGTASTEKSRKVEPALIARGKPTKAVNPQAVAQAKAAPPKPVAVAPAKKSAPQTPPPTVVAEQQTSADEPAVKIAKVKAVMVTSQTAVSPAQPSAEAAPMPRPRPQFVTASAAPRLDLGGRRETSAVQAQAAPSPLQPPEANESVLPKAAVRRPGTLNSQVAALSPSAAKDPEGLGMRPSQSDDTGAQAARAILNNAGSQAQAPADTKPAAAARPVGGGGGYLIQVGAFASAEEAQRHLESVRGKAADLLKDRSPRAEQAKVGTRQVYRARFAEFDSAAANAACSTLRQQKVECMVLKGQ